MADDEVTTRWMVIPVDELLPLAVTEGMLPESPSLRKLYDVVLPLIEGARWIERVHVLAAFEAGGELEPLDMFVSETGQLDGLPRNERATAIYRAATMLGRSGAPMPNDPEELPDIAGTAVLFNRRVWR